jgi:hypothetical protein
VARKLSARDMALGIGRKATDAELEEYLSRQHGSSVSLQKAVSQIKVRLAKKRSSAKK